MVYLTNSYDVSNDATKRFTSSTANTASNQSIATMSFWLKRRSALYRQELMNSASGSTNSGYLDLRSNDSGLKFTAGGYSVSTFGATASTTADALDEWVHYVMHWDTTTADGYSSRIYRNGVFLEGTYGNPALNTKCALTRGDGSAVSVLGGFYNFDGWMADLHIVDGLTVPVTDFADEQDGVWSAKEYSGSHGNNGAWFDGSLDVKDSVKVWSSNSLDASNLSTDIPPLYSVAPPIWASDLLVVSRDGVQYKITRAELDAYLKDGYKVVDSMLFNGTDAYLNRLPTVEGNRMTWTWSGWVKRGKLGVIQSVLDATNSAPAPVYNNIRFYASDKLTFTIDNTGTVSTTAVFRDPSAWYHVVVVMDTTQATSTDRIKMYVNGISQTLTGTYPALNEQGNINATKQHALGKYIAGNTQFYDGYLSEVNLIDGQALLPTDFGKIGDSGEWIPKKYTGTYGTNGFYLEALDSADLGKDTSGNGNNFTNENAVQVIDTPMDNFAVLNPLSSNFFDLSYGNTRASINNSSNMFTQKTTLAMPKTGKWYAEFTGINVVTGAGTGYQAVGICDINTYPETAGYYVGNTRDSYGYLNLGYQANNGGLVAGAGETWTTGDVLGVAVNLDDGILTFYKNGVAQGTPYTSLESSRDYCFAVSEGYTLDSDMEFNGGQLSFSYPIPTGFKAISTKNLPDATVVPSESFNTVTYSGTGTIRSITGVGFQPDFVWGKARNAAYSSNLYDSVRGATKYMYSNATTAEVTETNSLTSFDSDGFSTGVNEGAGINYSGVNYVAWNWKAGTEVTNNDGTIESQVSANPEAGFSVVTFADDGVAGKTIGHGLGQKPSIVIQKPIGTGNWYTLYDFVDGSYDYMLLNETAARFNSTLALATDTVFSNLQITGNSLAYCFADVEGYSKFDKFIGNSLVNGTFVYTGFKPAFVLIKNQTQVTDWMMFDNTRNPYNATDTYLQPNNTSGDASGIGEGIDLVSNGFKLRSNNPTVNGNTLIYMAFAEQPFKNANAR